MKTVLSFIAVLLSVATATSQTVVMVSPADNAAGVSKNLYEIGFETDYDIDVSSLDATPYGADSASGGYGRHVYLLPKAHYDSLSYNFELIKRSSIRGTLTLIDDTTLKFAFTAGTLNFETEYAVIVEGIRLVQVGPDTVEVAQSVMTFTTEQPPHYVSAFEPSGGLYRCGDTLKAYFNRKVTSTSNGSGPLAQFIRYRNSSVTSGIVTWEEDTVSATMSLSADSTVLFLATSGLDDSTYSLKIRPSIMTGDPSDTVSFSVEKHIVAVVTVVPAPDTAGVIVPVDLVQFQGAMPYSYKAGDTVVLTCPTEYDSLYFVRWRCEDDVMIDSSTSASITRTYDCTEIGKINAFPLYRIKRKDTVSISIIGSSYGSISVDGWADSLGSNTYTVWKGPGKALLLHALPTSAGRFKNWQSTGYSLIHGSTATSVIYTPGTNFGNTPVRRVVSGEFEPLLPCTNHSLKILADGETYSTQAPRSPVAPLSVCTIVATPIVIAAIPDYFASGVRAQTPAFDQMVTVTMTDDCYAIQCIKLDGEVIAGTTDLDPITGNWNGTVNVGAPNKCDRVLEIFIRKKTFLLTTILHGRDYILLSWKNETITAQPPGVEDSPWTSSAGFSHWERTVEYACSTEVTLTPSITKSGSLNLYKEMVAWTSTSGYTYTNVVDAPKKIIRFIMDEVNEDRVARMEFEEDVFLATHLILRSYSPYEYFLGDVPDDYAFPIYGDGSIKDQQTLKKVRVEFEGSGINQLISPVVRFNKTLELSRVKGSTKLHAEDYLNSRADYNDPHEYYDNVALPNPKEAEIFLKDGIRAWCASRFTLYWTSDITHYNVATSSVMNLANPSFTTLTIAPPLVTITLTRLEVTRDCDWDWGGLCGFPWIAEDDPEITVVASSAFKNITPHGAYSSLVESAKEDGVYDGMGEDEIKTPNMLVGAYAPRDMNSAFFVNFEVYDEDPAMPALSAALGSIATGLSTIGDTKPKEDKDYLNLGLSVIAAVLKDLVDGDGPDHVASFTGLHTFGKDLWGGMPSTKNSNVVKSRDYEPTNDVFKLKYSISLEPR